MNHLGGCVAAYGGWVMPQEGASGVRIPDIDEEDMKTGGSSPKKPRQRVRTVMRTGLVSRSCDYE